MLDKLTEKFSDITRHLSGKSRISEKNIQEAVEEIKLALLEADVNVRVVRRFVNRTISEAQGEKVLKAVDPGQQFIKTVHDRLVKMLGDEKQDLELKGPDTQSVILLMGLQGSGKTTTASKLAKHLSKKGRRVVLVAADLVRPAAITQLEVLGNKIGIPVIADVKAKDPVKLVKQALREAGKQQYDTVIVDTTGRLHVDKDMMAELKKIRQVADPVETLLVADAMTGQNAVNIAKTFTDEIGLSGVILSKFDSDARGGAALSLKSVTGTPVKFIGVGEKEDDLEPFYPDRMAGRILGMGDVVSLVEKAQEQVSQQEAEDLQKKLASKTFTLEDLLAQYQQMRKMGSVESIMKMMPGMAAQMQNADIDEKEIKHEEAIILSMTKVERRNHRIIGPSRKKRVALGSGTNVYQVNKLLKKFEKTRLMMKKMMKNKKLQSNAMSQFGV